MSIFFQPKASLNNITSHPFPASQLEDAMIEFKSLNNGGAAHYNIGDPDSFLNEIGRPSLPNCEKIQPDLEVTRESQRVTRLSEPLDPGFILANKQIYREALPILYSSSILNFTSAREIPDFEDGIRA
jgi:hypothetical protein